MTYELATINPHCTPGPWEDNGNGLIYGQCSGDDDEAPFVADVCNDPNMYTDQEQANARLIAAAPELLEALQETLGLLSGCLRNAERLGQPEFAASIGTMISVNRTAIAKAKAA